MNKQILTKLGNLLLKQAVEPEINPKGISQVGGAITPPQVTPPSKPNTLRPSGSANNEEYLNKFIIPPDKIKQFSVGPGADDHILSTLRDRFPKYVPAENEPGVKNLGISNPAMVLGNIYKGDELQRNLAEADAYNRAHRFPEVTKPALVGNSQVISWPKGQAAFISSAKNGNYGLYSGPRGGYVPSATIMPAPENAIGQDYYTSLVNGMQPLKRGFKPGNKYDSLTDVFDRRAKPNSFNYRDLMEHELGGHGLYDYDAGDLGAARSRIPASLNINSSVTVPPLGQFDGTHFEKSPGDLLNGIAAFQRDQYERTGKRFTNPQEALEEMRRIYSSENIENEIRDSRTDTKRFFRTIAPLEKEQLNRLLERISKILPGMVQNPTTGPYKTGEEILTGNNSAANILDSVDKLKQNVLKNDPSFPDYSSSSIFDFNYANPQAKVNALRLALLTGIAGTAMYNMITDSKDNSREKKPKTANMKEKLIKKALMFKLCNIKGEKDLFKEAEKPGLWANIRAKRARGEKPAKPGDKDYPDKKQWNKLTKDAASSPAWQRSEGKNPEGGLNAKGRASYKRETGGTLKAPVTESNPEGERAKRQNSFCSRMCGMKRVNTGSEAKNNPDSRINKSLRKWNCKCGAAHETFNQKLGCIINKTASSEDAAYKVQNIKRILDDSGDVKDYSADVVPNEGFIPYLKRNPFGLLGGALGGVAGAALPSLLARRPVNLESIMHSPRSLYSALIAAGIGAGVGARLGNSVGDKYIQAYLKDSAEEERIPDLLKQSQWIPRDTEDIMKDIDNILKQKGQNFPIVSPNYYLTPGMPSTSQIAPLPDPTPFLDHPGMKIRLALAALGAGYLGYKGISKLISKPKEKEKKIKKEAAASSPKPPSIKDIEKAYPYLSELFDKNRRTASSFERKNIVKNVPIASSYGEVLDAAKAQDLGFLKRHLLALTTRPTVWKGDNAFFLPQGKTGLIVSPKRINEAILRHELGHAEDYARLGGEKGWLDEYSVPADAPFEEAYRKQYLLPEARAWHYAGQPINLNPEDAVKERAMNTYVAGLDALQPPLR